MSTYANRTKVPPSKTRDEITCDLRRFGASRFRYYEDEERATIGFRVDAEGIDVAISLPMTGGAQEVASRWRTLGLAIKAKLALIECGGSTFEREFLADIMLPSGMTIHEAYEKDETIHAAIHRGGIEAKVISIGERASS